MKKNLKTEDIVLIVNTLTGMEPVVSIMNWIILAQEAAGREATEHRIPWEEYILIGIMVLIGLYFIYLGMQERGRGR